MIDVLVSGAFGKMGRTVVDAVGAAEDMRLVGLVDPTHGGETLETADGALICFDDLTGAIIATKPNVIVDFTNPSVVEGNVRTILATGVDCVLGTTGLSVETLTEMTTNLCGESSLFFAPNFTIGAVLMMSFAEQAAKHFDYAEIIEMHHENKKDAPSGTAIETARRMDIESIPTHSVRMPGYMASQEVILGSSGQTLTIRHDSTDRTAYMPGVLLAIREIGNLPPGLTVGLESIMDS